MEAIQMTVRTDADVADPFVQEMGYQQQQVACLVALVLVGMTASMDTNLKQSKRRGYGPGQGASCGAQLGRLARDRIRSRSPGHIYTGTVTTTDRLDLEY
jgi:hypothetical protein